MCGQQCLQFRDALLQWFHRHPYLLLCEARRDVFRTVPIEGGHINQEHALDAAAQLGRGRELVGELRMFAGVEDADMTQ